MRICPNCGKKFEYKIISIIFRSPWHKLRCDKCNTRIEFTKKTSNINSILVSLPTMFYVIFSEKIMNFITNFTKNENMITWGLILIYVLWGIIIYNGHFPWTKYKAFEEKKQGY